MKRRILSGVLSLVIMTVVLHNAIPHHHHRLGFLMHHHEMNEEGQGCHSDDKHPTEPCLIQGISFDIPRGTSSVKSFIQAEGSAYAAILLQAVFLTDPRCVCSLFDASYGRPLSCGNRTAFPARAPPC